MQILCNTLNYQIIWIWKEQVCSLDALGQRFSIFFTTLPPKDEIMSTETHAHKFAHKSTFFL